MSLLTTEIEGTRGYVLSKVVNGWILKCSTCGTVINDTIGEAFDHIAAEEKKFPNDE